MKRLYDDKDGYNCLGSQLDAEIRNTINDLFLKYYNQGYSARDISHVLSNLIYEIEHITLVGWNK